MNFNFECNIENQEKYYGNYVIPPEINKNVCIDLGSNVGFFALENYDKFNFLYAIDASYQNFTTTLRKIIYENVKNNKAKNVFCFNLAAAKDGGKIIKIYRHDNNGESVSPMTVEEMFTNQYKNWDETKETYHNVYSISLENLYTFFNIKYIDYLKVDIEGAEYDFLLNKDLSNIGCLALEIHGTLGQQKKDELKKYIEKYFEIYFIEYDDNAPKHSVITYINKNLNK